MKPTFLRLRNFKSIADKPQTIELAPVTLLFGPNSAGKSTVLQSLIYLKEALVHHNYDPDKTAAGGEWLDLGGFSNLVHGRDLDKSMGITLGMSVDGDSLPDYLSDHEREELEAAGLLLPEEWFAEVSDVSIGISVRWSDLLKKPFIETYNVSINQALLASIHASSDGKQLYLENLDLSHPIFSAVNANDDNEGESIESKFLELLNPFSATQSAAAVDTLLAEEMPFREKSLDELEQLIDGNAKGHRRLLEKIADELVGRTSRRSAALLQKLRQKLSNRDEVQQISYLGVTGQPDALPDPLRGLLLDKSAWATTDESEESNPFYRLLCESLLSGLVAGPVQLLTNWLDDFTYIGPLRDLPTRNLLPQKSPDRSRWAKGLAAWELLHDLSDRKIKEINFWMGSECLKTGYQVMVHRFRELATDSSVLTYLDREMDFDEQLVLKELIEGLPVETRVTMREEETELEVKAQDIGVGISQLLPVVVLTVTQESGLLAIEQPELHIHPAIQVELADLFARYAMDHNKIMLLETHSEHVMLRLLRRIRESALENDESQVGQLNKEDVSVQYVQSDIEGTRFERLRIDDDGDFLDEWPEGFFNERDQELFF